MDNTLYETITTILVETLMVDPKKITPDASLDLDLDSLDEVQFSRTLEKKFGITINTTEMAHIGVLSDIVELVSQNAPPHPDRPPSA